MPFKIIKYTAPILFNPSACRSYCILSHFSLNIYCGLTHYSCDLEGTTKLKLHMMQTTFAFTEQAWTHSFVSLCDAIMQKYRESQSANPKPMSHFICFLLCYLSLSAAYEVVQHVPLSFALTLRRFSLSQHASMSAALPTGSWFMNRILVCHYRLQ